jgi:hypothetical protein
MRKLLLVLAFVATAAYAEKPETVITTYYPKPGKDAEMLRILRDAWSVYTRLNLVTGQHQLYRATTEGGTSYFVEIFTWKDESIPDNAPPDVKKIWADMNANSKLDFAEITPVPDRPPTARTLPEPSRPSAADTR